jgi:lipopolysaccharide biosynthesis glycosyltransferase
MIPIWIGYDKQFEDNIEVLIKSIENTTSIPYQINLLKLENLSSILTRKRDPLQSTDSAFTRWLVPYLQDYTGWALYMDSDMMVRKDLKDLWDLKNDHKTIMVVKHKNNYKDTTKFNNNIQTIYPRKNWSSLMLFNCSKCRYLSLDYVNSASGLDLHTFKNINKEDIGSLPIHWNYLVGLNRFEDPAIVHWTLGGPWFKDFKDAEYSKEWLSVRGYPNQ